MFTKDSPEIKTLCELIQKEYLARLVEDGKRGGFDSPQHIDMYKNMSAVHVKEGKKYINIDIEHSGKYMVVKFTGEIFGIKAYGVIHRGHCYGTLATINDWYWGDYSARRKGVLVCSTNK